VTERQIKIDYTNYRGMRSVRTILPLSIWFGHPEFHLEEGWFLRAMDVAKGDIRDFYMPDIHEFITTE
jgi:predicted DNA-binding transcriptional regulator YafY